MLGQNEALADATYGIALWGGVEHDIANIADHCPLSQSGFEKLYLE